MLTTVAGRHGRNIAKDKDLLDNPRFDSELVLPPLGVRQAAELKITLKVYLDMGTPPPGADPQTADGVSKLYSVIPWGPQPPQVPSGLDGYKEGDFETFKRLFQQQTTSFWHRKMWLKTPLLCTQLDRVWPDKTVWRPNVKCGFYLQLVAHSHPTEPLLDVDDAHLWTVCWRLKNIKARQAKPTTTTTADGLVLGGGGPILPSDEELWRSDPLVLDALDVVARTAQGKVTPGDFTQLAVCHEIGHALGLHHPADNVSGCGAMPTTANPNTSLNGPYGDCTAAAPWMIKNIMGMGSEIRPDYNATPWLSRIEQHVPELDFWRKNGAQAANTTWVPGLMDSSLREGEVIPPTPAGGT